MLNDRSAILVVEDEPVIALDVTLAIEDAGGAVIGPASSVAQALVLLQTWRPSGAILDVNLRDGLIVPIIEWLVAREIPLIIQTGVGLPDGLAARFPRLLVLIKPVEASVLVARLAELLETPERPNG